MRPPLVAGVAGGVGTTTVAVALRGHETGRAGAAAADVLVCRDTFDSLRRAAALLDVAGPSPRPVLAVTLDGGRPPYGPFRARLELLEPAVSAIVLLPYVRSWRTVADPLPEVAPLLLEPANRLRRPVRAYAAAVRELAAAVVASGRLDGPPSQLPRPDAPEPPVARAAGARSAPRPPDPAPARSTTTPRVVSVFRPVVASATSGGAPQRGVRILPPTRPPAGGPGLALPVPRIDQAG